MDQTKQRNSKSHLQFRLRLTDQIIEKYIIVKHQAHCPSLTSSPLYFVAIHFTEIVLYQSQKTGKANTQAYRMWFKERQ